MNQWIRGFFAGQSELVLVTVLAGILLVLFTPIPAMALDFLLILNFSFALLILLLTFYMARPLEFSTFPSLLLVATLFRLSLNVSATRLILSHGDAGRVIGSVGSYVVSGNYAIGLIVFVVLIIVQYVVVTNGAQRVAEVAARFTLDAMPGKQMSIDADLNMGLIDQAEARERRKQVEREANFYGAMDGASRFVKGDAIAGILIVLVNSIGGLMIGVGQQGLPWGEALATYTLLTVGDGIVTQVPALIIATATGIIVTRAASDARLGEEVARQVLSHAKTIAIVAGALIVLACLPGIPAWPIAILVPALAGLYILARRKRGVESTAAETPATSAEDVESLYKTLAVEPVEVAVGADLISLVGTEGRDLAEKLAVIRRQYALEMGVVLPFVRVRDERRLSGHQYEVRIYGTRQAAAQVYPDRLLAINPGTARIPIDGLPALDPAYGLPATWIGEDRKQEAKAAGYTIVDAGTVFVTHIGEVLKQNAHNLITRGEAEKLVARVRESQAGLVDDLIPKVLSLSEVQKVLQSLVRERVPIRHIEAVIEVLADVGGRTRDTEALTEAVRERLGPQICQSLADGKGELHVITLDPAVEQSMVGSVRNVEDGRSALVMEPRFAEQVIRRLSDETDRMSRVNHSPVLLCAPMLRRHIRRFTERLVPRLAVLSLSEIPSSVTLRAFGVVKV